MTCPSLKFTLPRRKFKTKAHSLHLRSRSPPAPHFYSIKPLIIFCSDRMKSNRYQRRAQNTTAEIQSYCCPSRNQTSSTRLFFQHISRCTPSCCSPRPFSSPQQRCKKSKTLHTNCSRRCGAILAAAAAAAAASAAAAVSDSLSTFCTCTSASSSCNAAKQLQMLRFGTSQRNHIVINENTTKATEQALCCLISQ